MQSMSASVNETSDPGLVLPPSDLSQLDESPGDSSSVDLRLAGRRAQKRRRELGIKRAALEWELGLEVGALIEWEENGLPMDLSQIESGLERLLQVPAGWLRSPERRRQRSDGDDDTPADRLTDIPRQTQSSWQRRCERANATARSVAIREPLRKKASIMLSKSKNSGERVKFRRIALGIELVNLARALGIPKGDFVRIESRGWVRGESEYEKQLEGLLRVPSGWFHDMAAGMPDPEGALPVAATASEEIARLAIWLASGNLSDIRTFSADGLSPTDRRHASIFARRFGVYGSVFQMPEDDFKEQFGIGRSGVFLICVKMVERFTNADYPADGFSVIRRLYDEIQSLAPIRIEIIENKLRPLLGPRLSIEDLGYFFEFLFGAPMFSAVRNPMSRTGTVDLVIVRPHDYDLASAKLVRVPALQQIRYCGVASVNKIQDAVLAHDDRKIELDLLRAAVSCAEGFEWIDEGKGWFWLGPIRARRSTLFRLTLRHLAISRAKVDWATIQAVLNREQSIRHPMYVGRVSYMVHSGERASFDRSVEFAARAIYLAPPEDVLKNLLGKFEEFVVEDDGISLAVEVDPASLLAPRAYAIYTAIASSDGICTREQLMSATVGAGKMTPKELVETLRNSAFFMRSATGRFVILRSNVLAARKLYDEDDDLLDLQDAAGAISRPVVSNKKHSPSGARSQVERRIAILEANLPADVDNEPVPDGAGGYYCRGFYSQAIADSDVFVLPRLMPSDILLVYYRSQPGALQLTLGNHQTGRKQIAGLKGVFANMGLKVGDSFIVHIPNSSPFMDIARADSFTSDAPTSSL